MPILASRSTTVARSFILPSTLTARAALASPGPIEAAMSVPLTGLSNCRTDPSGKEMLIIVTTRQEEFEQRHAADAKRRRRTAGRRHKGSRPAESSSNGGQYRRDGEKHP